MGACGSTTVEIKDEFYREYESIQKMIKENVMPKDITDPDDLKKAVTKIESIFTQKLPTELKKLEDIYERQKVSTDPEQNNNLDDKQKKIDDVRVGIEISLKTLKPMIDMVKKMF